MFSPTCMLMVLLIQLCNVTYQPFLLCVSLVDQGVKLKMEYNGKETCTDNRNVIELEKAVGYCKKKH